jgi:predicted enzyme related to lactoylglutathione lyase
MSKNGEITWRDLTVPNADEVREFYAAVVGWSAKPHPMGEYDDYEMQVAETGETVAGICHQRGLNADVPPQWLLYVQVDDVEERAAKCRAMGGEVIAGPRDMGEGRFCVIRDPAGATLALYAPASGAEPA